MWHRVRLGMQQFKHQVGSYLESWPGYDGPIIRRVYLVSLLLAVAGYLSGILIPGRSAQAQGEAIIQGLRLLGLGLNLAGFALWGLGKQAAPLFRPVGLGLNVLNFVLVYVTGIILNSRQADSVFSMMMLLVLGIFLHLYTGRLWPSLVSTVAIQLAYVSHYLILPASLITKDVDIAWLQNNLPVNGFLLLFFFSAVMLLSLWVSSYLQRRILAHAAELAELAYHDPETRLPNLGCLEACLVEECPPLADRQPGRQLVLAALQLHGTDALQARIGYQAMGLWTMQFIQDIQITLQGYLASHPLLEQAGQHDLYRVGTNQFLFALWLAPLTEGAGGQELMEDLRDRTSRVVLRCPHGDSIAWSGCFSRWPGDAETPRAVLRNVMGLLHREDHLERFAYTPFDARVNAAVVRHNRLTDCLNRPSFIKELRTVFQPQARTDGLDWTGFEALVRWRQAELGDIPPMEFVPLAERHFRIAALTDLVLGDSLALAADLQSRGFRGFRIAFNLSPLLATPHYLSNLAERIATSGLAEFLELEITEGVLLKTDAATTQAFRSLRSLGVHFAIDDFGTGYSNLAYLQGFEADHLKIDRSFVTDMAINPRSRSLVQAILDVARTFGMSCVAEGVETPAQLELLQSLGCSLVQGYLISRPLEGAVALDYPSLAG